MQDAIETDATAHRSPDATRPPFVDALRGAIPDAGVRPARWILACLGLLLAAGCARRQPPPVFQALTGTAPVCWRMLCPGQTTLEEVTAFLAQQPEVEVVETHGPTDVTPESYTWWSFSRSARMGANRAVCFYRGERVSFCDFDAFGLSLDHVLEQFGDPETVRFVQRWADARTLTYFILYEEGGFMAVHGDFNWRRGEEVALEPGTKLEGFVIFTPADDETPVAGRSWTWTQRYLDEDYTEFPWQGYGVYDVPDPYEIEP